MKAELTNIKITITPEERGAPNAGPKAKAQKWRLVCRFPDGSMSMWGHSDDWSMTMYLPVAPNCMDAKIFIQPVKTNSDPLPAPFAFIGAPTLRELLGLTPPKPVVSPPDHDHELLMFTMRVHIAEMQKILDDLAEVTK